MTYPEALALRNQIETRVSALGAVLRAFPSRPNGLTPDDVKATPAWQTARALHDSAFAELRAFNARFVKMYAEELRADRDSRRA